MSDFEQKPAPEWGKVGQNSGAKMGQDLSRGARVEKKRTARLKETLPGGITIGERVDGRKQPFFIRYGTPRKQRFFQLEGDRNDAAEKIAEAKRINGSKVLDFDPEEWQEFLAFKKRVGATLQEVERVYSKFKGGAAIAISTKAALTKYLELRGAEGLAEDSTRHAKTILRRFAEFAGHLPLGAIDADKVREWLGVLKKRHGFENTTLRHHRKEVNTFFNRAMLEKWHSENPCRAVIPPKFEEREILFLSLKEAFIFFKANRSERVIGKLAAEAFGGIRCSAVSVMPKSDVDMQAKGIVIAALKTTGQRHYIDGFPSNLWEWLEFADSEDNWDITPRNYAQLKGVAFKRANVQNTGNVLRHSFATHHVAAFRDTAKTATLLCHNSPAMLYRHYRGRGVPQKEAEMYFKITPESTKLTWEEFVASI